MLIYKGKVIPKADYEERLENLEKVILKTS